MVRGAGSAGGRTGAHSQSVAAALGAPALGTLPHDGAAAGPLTFALTELLRDRTALLVLESCEHLVEGCAQLASALLRTCRGLRILATSRQTGLTGETVWHVPPLAPEEAVQLFAERAADVSPDRAADVPERDGRRPGVPAPRRVSRWPLSWPPRG